MSRDNPAPLKVIGLGLGRTGTDSLRLALDMLGFGPCYHMKTIIAEGGKDFPAWFKIGDGNGTPEMFDDIFRDFNSVVDYPEAKHPAEMYAAYPNAKFILTIRDPAKWEKSMKETVLLGAQALPLKPNKTEAEERLTRWLSTYLQEKYHGGRLQNHAQQEFRDHNERVKQIIPAEQLLVYEVGEGWDRLVEFLGVPKPTEPFPHVNDTATFQGLLRKLGHI